FHDWDWPRAERGLLKAIELNPGYATGRRWYAQFLSGMGRHDEASAEAERARAGSALARHPHRERRRPVLRAPLRAIDRLLPEVRRDRSPLRSRSHRSGASAGHDR